jgi:hypothetical protein
MGLKHHRDDEMIYAIRVGEHAEVEDARDSDSGWAITIGRVMWCGWRTKREAREHLAFLRREAATNRNYLPVCHGVGVGSNGHRRRQ